MVTIGALVPLTAPGWTQAGRHLLAGLELGVRDANSADSSLELIVRDTAANPDRAVAAVDELAGQHVAALVGEYHSVVARAVASRASDLGLPFLCSSAVLDALTDEPTDWVARLSPPQSRGWRAYADFLLAAGHHRVAVVAQASPYWAAGIQIVRDRLSSQGGTILEVSADNVCDDIAQTDATVLLLLTGHPEPALSIVDSVRRDPRTAEILIGAPAGQPEFAEWATPLRADIPFLRYLPETLTPLGDRVTAALRELLPEPPSFVALEGYDAIRVLAEYLRTDRRWADISIDGTRGHINFTRTSSLWQWTDAPIQIAARSATALNTFDALHP
ncbi:ABC transporter substrate-binding protein [Kribbella sp. NPDC051952]|uniref:ABC transporter substrate-binding protein n=1 Tax=Kribbella sp. NPDC051952 TaxID=3154851 RepID=UPI003429E183